MKLRYLLPFLLLPFLPRNAEAQFKAEGNRTSLDIKSGYLDVSARDTFGLDNLANIKGGIKLRYRDNSIYGIRNGALNHSYGGNLNIEFLEAYHNRSSQSTRTETCMTQNSPIGEITTETTILDDTRARDFGFSLNHRNFFASYESARAESGINGSTIITIGEDQNLVPFSSESNNSSIVYGVGFRNGFFKFIQNRQQSVGDEEEQSEERHNNFLANANSSFSVGGRRINLNVYYDKDFSGFFNLGLFRNIDLNLIYDSHDGDFRVNLSTPGYSRLNQRDFERGLENRLRVVPRIYDSPLEITRSYLSDMFLTPPFSYNFTVDEDEIIANLNLRNILVHYSRGSQAVGLKLGPAIGAYDFKQDEARFGVFFGGREN